MYNLGQRIHFVGIGGVGMAGIAEVLLSLGYRIQGSDVRVNRLVEHLRNLGAEIMIGHDAENLHPETDVMVVSSAISSTNPELEAARARKIPVIPRAEMLAELMRMKYGIAVAGSHGKTTTTSMLAKLLRDAGLDPTVIVGGRVLSEPTGATLGMGQYLVAEADESDGSFCLLKPAIAIVTNIDREHLGHYGSFGELEASFERFIQSIPFYGLVVGCADDPLVLGMLQRLERRSVSYGLSPNAHIQATDIVVHRGVSEFTLSVAGQERGRVLLPLPGVHLVSNALAAIAIALELGATVPEVIESLRTFAGVARRSEVLFRSPETIVIDDYAHHPTELAATLSALRQGWIQNHGHSDDRAWKRLIAVFQPHRYTRTQELFTEFLNCFSAADRVLVTEVYSASEAPIAGVSGESLAGALRHQSVEFVSELSDLIPHLESLRQPGDVFVTLGAGSITGVGHEYAQLLSTRQTCGRDGSRAQSERPL